MAKQSVFNNVDLLRTYLVSLEGSERSIFLYFTGNKDQANNESWCPDCNVADPVIKRNLCLLSDKSEFITCFVGDRSSWKNQLNEFRIDKEIQLKRIPTLMQWKKVLKKWMG